MNLGEAKIRSINFEEENIRAKSVCGYLCSQFCCIRDNRDLKQRRRRRQGRRLEKIDLYFTVEFRRWLDLFSASIGLGTCPSLICNASVQFQTKIRKISRCRSRSPKYSKLGHFTLLFCRGRLRNVQRIITHVHSYCFAH